MSQDAKEVFVRQASQAIDEELRLTPRREGIPTPLITPEQVELVKRTVAMGATDDELKMFLYDCQRRNVHPLDRLLHFTVRADQKTGKRRYTPIVSIDLFRTRAAETQEHAGTDDAVFDPAYTKEGDPASFPAAAHVTVYRLVGVGRYAFAATARWTEYYPGDGNPGFMWRKMPYTMLAKCAEALALRKAFPAQLAGLYTSEEMDQAAPEPSKRVGIPRTGEPWKGNATPGPLSDAGEYGDTPEPNLKSSWRPAEPVTLTPLEKKAETVSQAHAAAFGLLRHLVEKMNFWGTKALENSVEGKEYRQQIYGDFLGPIRAVNMTDNDYRDLAGKLKELIKRNTAP